ncbi:MAG: HAD family phosphatase [Nitrospirota bacterium]
MKRPEKKAPLKAVLFDFGGVLAEEGFRGGLKAVALKDNRDPERFFEQARELIYEIGYVTGQTDEASYWSALREETGITWSDGELREEILKRFVLRRRMLRHVERLRYHGIVVALLSDQTNWLDELNRRDPFYHYFDHLFNSFTLHKSKRDPSIFMDAAARIGFRPGEMLFVDDDKGNTGRATERGYRVIHFQGIDDFEAKISAFV